MFPRLVYCHLTGYGIEGPDVDRPAYDIGAFFARAGVGATLLTEDAEPLMRTGAFGDYYTAFAAASGVCVALVGRQTTGEGQLVSTSLLRTGAFCVSHSFNQVMFGYPPSGQRSRTQSFNPMIGCYRDSNRKWFYLLGLQGDRIWPAVTRSIGRPELEKDPRFDSLGARTKNAAELMALLDDAFAVRPLAEWAEIFDREGVWWSPVQNVNEALKDPQMRAAGAFAKIDTPEGEREIVPAPVDFDQHALEHPLLLARTRTAYRRGAAGDGPHLGGHRAVKGTGRDWLKPSHRKWTRCQTSRRRSLPLTEKLATCFGAAPGPP